MAKEFDAEKEMFEAKRLTVKTNLEEYLRNYVIEDIKMISELSEKVKTLSKKHHKATNKITEFAKENKTLKQTILLMEENQRQKERFWIGGSVQPEDNSLEIKQLESDVYKYKTRWEATEKELKEATENNEVYLDILSTVFNDVEEIVSVYMQGKRRGELDE